MRLILSLSRYLSLPGHARPGSTARKPGLFHRDEQLRREAPGRRHLLARPLTAAIVERPHLRAAEAELALHREEIDLVALIGEVAAKLQPAASHRGVTIEVEAGEGAVLSCDRLQIERVVFNLIDNAISYSPADESVGVNVTVAEKQIQIEVRDSGPGIAAEHLPHLFGRFYRADQSRSRDHEGAGLGLAIVKTFVEAHGGMVEARSEVGKGSVFVVRLPAVAN